MKINEFAKKYGVPKRSVDYWTNIGILHPECEEKNKYRHYNEQTEEEIKRVLILQAMNLPINSETMRYLENVPKEMFRKWILEQIRQEQQRVSELYDLAYEYAVEIFRRR